MRHLIYLLIICILIFSACSSPYQRTGEEGYEYKVIEHGKGKKLGYGKFLEFHLKQWYINVNGEKDTVLGDTREYMQRIEAFDSLSMPPLYLNVLNNTRKGDSILIRIATDSAYRQFTSRMPKHFKSGGHIYTSIKVLNIFDTRKEADSVNIAEFRLHSLEIYQKNLRQFEMNLAKEKEQIASDSKIIGEYLDKNNIKYARGKWGTFIVVYEEGIGRKIAYNDVVAVNYTRRSFDGKEIFDSNLDPKFGHEGPYEVTMSRIGEVIAGWTDGLMELREGAKASLYIPSSLAYGKKGRKKIKPNENVVFDIEVKVVITEIRAMEIVSGNRRRSDSLLQRQEDSLKKAKNPLGF